MQKDFIRRSNIQLVCGQAKPGANLAFLKNMALFCREFNEKTKDRIGTPVNVEITVKEDKSYVYSIKKVPTSFLIKQALEKNGQGFLTTGDLEKIAAEVCEENFAEITPEEKQALEKTVLGTAKSFNNFKGVKD
jgi:large subunit ribosomal protein L11